MDRYELPEGWEWRALGDPQVAEINPKKSVIRHLADDLLVTFVPMEAVSDESGTITAPIQRFLGEVRKGYTYFSEGDVIFAKITPCMENGKSAIALELTNSVGFGSTEFHVFRPGPKVTAKWLHCLLRSKQLRDEAKVAMTGAAGQQRVPRDFLAAYEIPIPPPPEQNRLVARIEAFAERIEIGRKVQREAIANVEGMFEHAMNLVFSEDNIADWPEYPTVDLFSMVSGQIDPRQEPYSDMPSVAPDNVEKGTGRLIGQIKTAGDLELSSGKYLFRPEHVIYSKIRPALRKVCIPRFAGVCSADMYALKPNTDLISQDFLLLSLLSPPFTNYAVDNSDRNAMPKINRKVLFGYRMRVPDFPTQERLSAYLLGIRERSDEIACLQRSANSDLAALLPAILAKAFRGEL